MSYETRVLPPIGNARPTDAFSTDSPDVRANRHLDDDTERRLRLAARDAALNDICRRVARASLVNASLRNVPVTVQG